MTKRVELRSGHHTVLFEFTKDGLHLYTSCCGAPVPRREAKQLHKALTKWLGWPKGDR
jgi:hypothetical protein